MKLSRKNPDNLNITVMEYTKAKGLWVRIVKNGEMHQKFFSRSEYGGVRKALEAARKWRDATRRKLKMN